jgi:hypothetical protein
VHSTSVFFPSTSTRSSRMLIDICNPVARGYLLCPALNITELILLYLAQIPQLGH